MTHARQVLAAVLATSALLATRAGSAAMGLEAVDTGVAGLVRAGDWARLELTMAVDGDGFRGTVYCDLGEGEVRRELSLPPLGRETWEGAAIVSPLASEGTARWTDHDGQQSTTHFDVAPSLAREDVGVLALTTERGLLAMLADQAVADWLPSAEQLTGRFVVRETGSVLSLPQDWIGWSGVDVVAWSGVDPISSSWTPARRQALVRWIAQGGTLVCFDDGMTDAWGQSFLAPHLPIAPGGRAWLELPSRAEGQAQHQAQRMRVQAFYGQPTESSRPVLPGLSWAAQWQRLGMGAVFFVGVPQAVLAARPLDAQSREAFQRAGLVGPLDTWESALWSAILAHAPPAPLRMWNMPTTAQREQLLARLDATEGSGIPPRMRRLAVGTVAWMLVLVALGLWAARRQRRFGWSVILLAMAGASAIPIALRSRTPSVAADEMGIVRVVPGLDEAYWHGIVSVPPMEETSVRVPFWTDPHAMPLTQAPGVAWLVHTREQDTAGELTAVRTDQTRARHWQGRTFVPFSGEFALQTKAHWDDVPEITNNTPWTFERAAVLHGTKAAFVYGVHPGQTVTFPLVEASRRRAVWSELGVPAPVFGYWSREGLLDALVPEHDMCFLGWLRGVAVAGPKASSPSKHLLLVIAPLDIKVPAGSSPAPARESWIGPGQYPGALEDHRLNGSE